jgi:hypothetical protein
MITAVTAFVPIPGHPRPEAEYRELGHRLLTINQRVLSADGDLTKCWLYEHLKCKYDLDTAHFSYSIADNPQKNSLWYHIIQAQKTEWLEMASAIDPFSDVFVWIDYGIFHVPGITSAILEKFLERADSEQAIAIPGCWQKDQYPYNDEWPYWRFCGGVMVVPRKLIEPFNHAMKREYVRWLEKTHNISWEVNTLARLEQQDLDFPVWWYQADHNQTMFTNYRATEYADERPTALARSDAGYHGSERI